LETARRNKAAILWEGEPGEERTLTYQQLHREVCRFANGLKSLGIQKGDRVNDCQSKLVVTADGGYRRGSVVALKKIADEGLQDSQFVKKVVVFKRLPAWDTPMQEGRDVWWHDVVKDQPGDCDAEVMDSEDMLFLLYTSEI